MRVGTWNCRGAFDRKAVAALADLVPDVLVVPECHATPAVASQGWQYRYRHVRTKGIGVLVAEGWGVEEIDPPDGVDRRWVLPLRLHPPGDERPPFLLLAVWTVAEKGGPSYVAQFAEVLDVWGPSIRAEPTVIAGDLNTSAQGPSAEGHARNVALAWELGLVSSYHRFHGAALGDERDMTLRWVGRANAERRYHCDLVFVPESWVPAVRCVEVGDWATWILSKRSDHAPVVVELDDATVPVRFDPPPLRRVLVRKETDGRVDEVVRVGDVLEWSVDGEVIHRDDSGDDPFAAWPDLLVVDGNTSYTIHESLDPGSRAHLIGQLPIRIARRPR